MSANREISSGGIVMTNMQNTEKSAVIALRSEDPAYMTAQQTRRAQPLGSAFVGILCLIVSIAVMLGTAYAAFIGARAVYRCLDDKGTFDGTVVEYIDFKL